MSCRLPPTTERAPLGLLVAMDRADRRRRAGRRLLKIFAVRIVAEIERSRDEPARRAGGASAHGETVCQLTLSGDHLHVELAFIARRELAGGRHANDVGVLRGRWIPESRYPLESSPCAHVLGQRFRVYPARLRELFPDDRDAQALGLEGYAGFPLTDRQGLPLGTLGVASRKPLVHLERIESMRRSSPCVLRPVRAVAGP
jgi:hypothetical protein